MKRSCFGFTLLEVLIATALIGVVLTAALGFLGSSSKAYGTLESAATQTQIMELAAEVLRYELELAGYAGAGVSAALSGAGIELHPSGRPDQPDAITIRYVEDRWLSQPTERAIRFEVGTDGNGTPNLYRREHGSARQPAVQEITNLKLRALFTPDGATRLPRQPWPERITGLQLDLEFSWGVTRSVTVAFGTPQSIGGT